MNKYHCTLFLEGDSPITRMKSFVSDAETIEDIITKDRFYLFSGQKVLQFHCVLSDDGVECEEDDLNVS